jgi:molybdopterin converting factor small subunit
LGVKIKIPVFLQKFTGGEKIIETLPGKLSNVLSEVIRQFPELKIKLFNNDGNLKSYVKIYSVSFSDNALMAKNPKKFLESSDIIKNGETLVIMMPIAGG